MKANWRKKICTVLLSFMMVVVMTPTSAIAAATEAVPSQDQPAATTEVKNDGQAVKDAQPEEKAAEESAEKPAEEKADETAEKPAEEKAGETAEHPVEEKADNAPAETQGDAAKAADASGKVSYPAMTLTAKAGGVTVTLKAPEGSLPEGAKLNAKQVSQKYIDAVESKLEAQGRELTDAVAVDVTPVDKNGKEIQPKKAVTVTFTGAGLDLESGDSVDVFRVSDDAATVTDMNGSGNANSATFSTNHFTIYVQSGSTTNTNGDGTMNGADNPYVLSYGGNITLNSNTSSNRWEIDSGSGVTLSNTQNRSVRVTNNNTTDSDQSVVIRHHRASSSDVEYFYITAKAPQRKVLEYGETLTLEATSGHTSLNWIVTQGSGAVELSDPSRSGAKVKNINTSGNDVSVTIQHGNSNPEYFYITAKAAEKAVTFMYMAPGETTFTQEAKTDIVDGSVTPPTHSATIEKGGKTYVYSGWCSDAACETPVTSFDNLTVGMTVYSKYTAQHTVNFHLKDAGESSFDVVKTENVLDGKDATAPGTDVTPATKTVDDRSYNFSGWYTDDTFTTQATLTGVTADMDVYAKYIPIVKLTYKKNSGTDAATVPVEVEYPAGTTVELGTATREGYAFMSWNTKKDGSGDSYGAGIDYDLPEDDTVLYAQWSEEKVTVTYYNNFNTEDTSVYYTDADVAGNNPHYTIIDTAPMQASMLFRGWATSPNGTVLYAPKGYFKTGTEDISLYAIWAPYNPDELTTKRLTAKGKTVTYNGIEQTIKDVEENDCDNNTRRKYEGYVRVFNGTGQTNIYAKIDDIEASGTEAGSYSTPLTASLWYRTGSGTSAQWHEYNEAIPVDNHTLTIEPVELTVATVGARKLYDGDPLTANGTVTRGVTEKEFTPDGTNVTLANGETIFIKATGSQTEEGKSNNTYEIDWSNSTAEKVNYKVNEGTIGELEVYKIPVSYKPNAGGDTVKDMPEDTRIGKGVFSLPEKAPSREHYNFLGWGLTADQKTDLLQPGDPYEFSEETESITFYAIWEAKTYTLTFDPNGGTFRGATSQYVVEYKYGETITIPEAPTREGYEFVCWRGSEYQPGDTYLVEGNHIFTAEWEAVEADDTDDDSDSTSVKTGDEHNVFVWITVMLAAIAALAVMAVRRRKLDK